MRSLKVALICVFAIGLFAPAAAFAASEEDIEASITSGITWLVAQQDPISGSWGSYELVAHTGFAVIKLEDRAYELDYDSPFDPAYEYADEVTAGVDFILSQAVADGNGGLYFDNGFDYHQTYNTGIGLMAIAGSRTPTRVYAGGGPASGMSYADVVDAVVAWYVANQSPDGGFKYNPETNEPWDRSDNSNTGYAVLGLRAAEAFGAAIPQSLKDNLNGYIGLVQCTDVLSPDFGGSGYVNSCGDWVNLLKTGNLLFEMAFVGDDASTQRVKDAVTYIQNHWDDANWDPGWKGPGWVSPPSPHYQSMYAMMKGLESLQIDVVTVGTEDIDWFDVMADSLLASQLPDGSWPSDYWGNPVLTTAWAILTLEKVVPNDPPDCSLAYASIDCIWPPNHKMVDVDILGVTDPEGDPITITVTMITQDEPLDTYGDGSFEPDADGVGTSTAQVRAERSGTEKVPGNGRVYEIVFTAEDDNGGECTGSVTVCVPHDQGKGTACQDDGQCYDSVTGAVYCAPKLALEPEVMGFESASYPNPFNPATTIYYALPEGCDVRLTVYNALGQQVKVLQSGYQSAGRYHVVWEGVDAEGRNVTSGLYLYRLVAGRNAAVGKMVLAK